MKQIEVSHRRKMARNPNHNPSSSRAQGNRLHSEPELSTREPEALPYPDYVEAGDPPPSYQEVMSGNYLEIHP